MIYLDYAATTPLAPEAFEEMRQCLLFDGDFANPASRSHRAGWLAEQRVENARMDLAECLHCDPRDIVFTSGATEANNLALKGYCDANAAAGDEIIVSRIEHKAVLDVVDYLEGRGYRVHKVAPEADGTVLPERVYERVSARTRLVSVMHVNNETGAINDVAAMARYCRERGICFHVDAAQSVGKLPINLANLPVHMLSLSAHKFYGPKGIGALFVRRSDQLRLTPLLHGGGHERGYRSGTLPTHQIVAMAAALRVACEKRDQERERLAELRTRLADALLATGKVKVNGTGSNVGHILSLCFLTVEAESLVAALPQLAVSSGSACNSASMAPSYVLKAMGLSDRDALNSLRISLGRFTTADEIDEVGRLLASVIKRIG